MRVSDEELDFLLDDEHGASNIDMRYAYELRDARTEIEFLKKVCYEKQAALTGRDVEWMKCMAELNKTKEELETLREHRHYASPLIDCAAKCKKYETALKTIRETVMDAEIHDIAHEALKP